MQQYNDLFYRMTLAMKQCMGQKGLPDNCFKQIGTDVNLQRKVNNNSVGLGSASLVGVNSVLHGMTVL